MSVDRLPSGNYRIRQMIDGQKYSFVLDHKPTRSEITRLVASAMGSRTVVDRSSVEYGCRNYIESKSNVLSPSTVRGYYSILRQLSPSFAARSLASVTLPVLQAEVNSYSADHSPKSTKNYAGFLQSVLKFYGAGQLSVTVPQKEKKPVYIPSKEEVQAIFAEIKGTKYEVPISLAALGLRRSEICALTLEDLDGNVLTINKAIVQDKEKKWVIKTTKTTDSTRTIVIPDALADLIRKQGYIYDGCPELIYRTLSNIQKKLGIPHFSLHKMRHFFVSYMHDLGYSDKQIQEFGGWKTDIVMKTVYQHAMDMDEAKKKMAGSIGSLFPS